MAKRDLDKEFKENLQGQGPFQFSEENWKAASAMLDNELPVAAGGKFFNRTTLILSIAVLFLLSLTILLPLKEDVKSDQNKTESSISESSNATLDPITNEVKNSPIEEYQTKQNENHKSSPYEDISVVETLKTNDKVSSDADKKSTVYKETNSIKEKKQTESQIPVIVSNSALDSDKNKKSDLQKTNGLETTPVPFIAKSSNEVEEKNKTSEPENSIETEIALASLYAPSSNALNKTNKASEPESTNEEEITSTSLYVPSPIAIAETGTNQTLQDDGSEANVSSNNDEANKNSEAIASETNKTFETEDSQDNSNVPIAATNEKVAKTNNRLNQNYFKAGFETGIFATNRTLTTTDLECEDFVTKRNSEESMKPSYYFGLNFGQQINKLNWQVGLNYSTYQENISYNNEVLGLDLLDNGYWNQFNAIDTTLNGKWVIDSIYAGHWEFDTTYTNVVDSNYIEQWDTTVAVKLDSTIQQNNGVHNLSYFEIPLFVGYTFGKNKWLFDVQPGVSIGFLSGSRGSRYIDKSLSGLVEPSNNLEQFNKVIWKAHFRIGVRYAFEKWDFGIYPHYSYTLNNVLNSSKVDQRYGNFGVSIGAYYKF